MAKVLHTLSVPTRKDLDTLSHHVAELTAVTKRLSETMEEPGTVRKGRAPETPKHM